MNNGEYFSEKKGFYSPVSHPAMAKRCIISLTIASSARVTGRTELTILFMGNRVQVGQPPRDQLG
jgi:hypothetical protein